MARTKVWLELNRQGIGVARCTTERLMRQLGLQGVRRGRKVRTTVPGKDGLRAPDRLRRDFTAPAPNRCARYAGGTRDGPAGHAARAARPRRSRFAAAAARLTSA